jgi:hypothetical protein
MEPSNSTTAIGFCRLPQLRSSATTYRAAAWCSALAALGLVLTAAGAGNAQDRVADPPVDAVLRLVPPDAAVVLSVENLRDQIHAFTKSRLYTGLKQLPSVKAWIESDKAQQLLRSRDEIEAALGTKLGDICDELIGDAVVLALRLPPDGPADPSQARGLLLVQARNSALLERVIQTINDKQKASGELAQITARQHGGSTYYTREFPPAASRPSEWYITYPDGTFAFSNSESMIHSVIDRKGRERSQTASDASPIPGTSRAGVDLGLTGLTRFQSVRRRQPTKPLARLFIEPRQIERLIALKPRPSKASDARIMAMLERYLAAVEYAGATLEWNDTGVDLQTVETLNRSKLDPWLVRWAGNDLRPDPTLTRVPATTIALASGHVDVPALYEGLCQIVPDEEQSKLRMLETMLGGLLLGQDLRTRILPQLGPGVLAYIESPPDTFDSSSSDTAPPATASGAFAQVLVASLRTSGPVAAESVPGAGGVTAAAAIENALRTVLALSALDEKRNNGRSQITTRSVAGANVTTLDFPIPFAYAVDITGSRLIAGTSPSAVARYLEAASNPKAGDRFRQFRARAFPDAETFLCVDLAALGNLAGRQRERLVEILATRKNRPAVLVDGDLSQVLAFARLFEAAFVTSRFEPEAAAVHRRIGLLTPDPKTPT